MDHRHLYKSTVRRNPAANDRTATNQRRQIARQSLHSEHRPGVSGDLSGSGSNKKPAPSVATKSISRPAPIKPISQSISKNASAAAPSTTNLAPNQLMRMRQDEYRARFLEWQRTKKEQKQISGMQQKKPFSSAVAKPPPGNVKDAKGAKALPSLIPNKKLTIPGPASKVKPPPPRSKLPPPIIRQPIPTVKPIQKPIVAKSILPRQPLFPKSTTSSITAAPNRMRPDTHKKTTKQDVIANKKQLLAGKIAQKMKAKIGQPTTSKIGQPATSNIRHPTTLKFGGATSTQSPKKAFIVKPVPRRLVPADKVSTKDYLKVPKLQISEARPKKSMEWLHAPQPENCEEQSFDSNGTLVTSTAHKSFKSARKASDSDPLGVSPLACSPIEMAKAASPVTVPGSIEAASSVEEAGSFKATVDINVAEPQNEKLVPVVVDLDVTPLDDNLADPVASPVREVEPRRSSSGRKEWSRRDTLESCVPVVEKVNDPRTSAVEFFTHQLDDETKKLGELAASWFEYKEQHAELEGKHIDMIDVAIGQTRLLVGSKFDQFRKLVAECKNGPASSDEKPVLPDDLEGFWGMVYIQVDNCKASFAKLDQLRKTHWTEEPDVEQVESIKPKKTKSKKTAAKAKPSKDFLEHLKKLRKEQRLKLTAETKENRSPSGTQRLLKTPVASRKSLLTEVLNKEARKSVLPTAGPSATSSPVTHLHSAFRRSMRFDGSSPRKSIAASPVPKSSSPARRTVGFVETDAPSPKASRKSILKTPGPPKTKRKGVMFADVSSPEKENAIDWKPTRRSPMRFAVTPIATHKMKFQSINEMCEADTPLVSTSPFHVSSIADESLPPQMSISRRTSFYLTPTSGKSNLTPTQRRALLETSTNLPWSTAVDEDD